MERVVHKVRGTEDHGANPLGSVDYWALPVKDGRGGSRRAGSEGRQRDEGTLGHENPWGLQEPGSISRMAKGRQLDKGRKTQARANNSLWPPGEGGNLRRAVGAGGWGHHPGGWLLHAQGSWKGKKLVQRESEAVSTGGRRRSDVSQVQEGKHDIQKWMKQVGREESIIFLKIVTKPWYGAIPVRGCNTTTS